MPSLHEVCAKATPFPPSGVEIDITGSPNIFFYYTMHQLALVIANSYLAIGLTSAGNRCNTLVRLFLQSLSNIPFSD